MKLTNLATNQNIVYDGNTATFFSYGTVIATETDGSIALDSFYWCYSKTTLKYLKVFLNTDDTKKAIQDKIDSGEYKAGDLQ